MEAVIGKEDHKWRGKKMEGEESLNTVECLRGRLLAERQASKVAKQEAESTGNKLVELEKKLGEEIKLREKAERKLKFLKKKLESFNISSISGESEQSYSSNKCENSCRSTTGSSVCRNLEENETKPHTTNTLMSESSMGNVSEASAPIRTRNGPSVAKDYDSQATDNSSCNSNPDYDSPQNLCGNPNPNSEDFKNDESRVSSSSSKSSTRDSIAHGTEDYSSNTDPGDSSITQVKNDDSRLSSLSSKSSVMEDEDDDGDFVDNSLAIVPVNLPTLSSQASNPNPVRESVNEVLDALRNAREKLLGSMGTGQIIKVGPA